MALKLDLFSHFNLIISSDYSSPRYVIVSITHRGAHVRIIRRFIKMLILLISIVLCNVLCYEILAFCIRGLLAAGNYGYVSRNLNRLLLSEYGDHNKHELYIKRCPLSLREIYIYIYKQRDIFIMMYIYKYIFIIINDLLSFVKMNFVTRGSVVIICFFRSTRVFLLYNTPVIEHVTLKILVFIQLSLSLRLCPTRRVKTNTTTMHNLNCIMFIRNFVYCRIKL